MEFEIGIGKTARRAYGFDEVAIVPSRRTRDPEDVNISWEIDAFKFDSSSFAIEEIDGAPMVGFHVPGAGPGSAGLALPLPHVRAPEPSW